jgi:O-Antigen ligase
VPRGGKGLAALQDRIWLNQARPDGRRGGRPDHLDRRVLPGLVLVLAAVAGLRDGGFWHAGALAVALIAGVLLATAVVATPPNRRSAVVIAGLGLLALWWYVRSVTAGSGTDFLPLGASIIAFAAAFAAVRPLVGRAREEAALAMAALGAVGALAGFAGLSWRWFPLAMPAQGLWRLSSSLTYADAAGLVFGVCLLLALGCARAPAVVRVVVCLNVAGLLATQSRGALVAVACGCLLVPARRYGELAVPLLAGSALGVAAIASSPENGSVPWLAAVLVLGVALAAASRPGTALRWSATHIRVFVGLAGIGAALAGALLIHHEIGLRVLAPSDQDRSAEWLSGFHQWLSAPLAGVGPDRLLELHASDGSSARFVHNEYLQMAADGGLVGLGFLGLVALSLARTLRRIDQLLSCAVAALVCWAVGGFFDFSWHLPVVGLLGGWCAGLAVEGELIR